MSVCTHTKSDMTDYKKINIRNKRATFDYEILEEFLAGVVLVGTEIKSLRLGKASMVDTYCYFDRGELWLRGLNIAEYGWGPCNTHAPKRDRKLLLNRKELDKLQRSLQDRGLTVVGLRIFLIERGLAKVELFCIPTKSAEQFFAKKSQINSQCTDYQDITTYTFFNPIHSPPTSPTLLLIIRARSRLQLFLLIQ